MNRTRLFFSGLFAVLSLSAAPVFASPAYTASAPARAEIVEGYRAPTPEALTEAQVEARLEAKVLALVNQARTYRGLPTLKDDARATASARIAATEGSREGSFAYLRNSVETRLERQGVSASYDMVETTKLLKGSERDLDAAAQKIVQGWLKDPKVSRQLFDANLTYGGVGAVSAKGSFAVALDAFGQKPLPRPLPKPATHC